VSIKIRQEQGKISNERNLMKKFLLVLIILLAACAPLQELAIGTDTPTPTPVKPTDTPIPQPQCAFVWAYQDLPDLSKEVDAAIKQTVQPDAATYAQAYGENCIDADGNVAYFTEMETDYTITLRVNDLTDEENLGKLIEQVITILENRFPTDKTPGPQAGYVTIIYQSDGQESWLHFTQKLASDLINNGFHGAELYQKLK
jgi:hypothetical protein